MSKLSCPWLAMVMVLGSLAPAAQGEFWNPFDRREDEALSAEITPARSEESRWFLLPPLKWPVRPDRPGPSLWQQWQTSTQRTLTQTREAITAPFEEAAARSGDRSIWPRWPGFGSSKSSAPPGWFDGSPSAPARPATVNDFLAQPRPE